jgi:hypothetical protein
MSFGLPLKADIALCGRHFASSKEPGPLIEPMLCRDLLRSDHKANAHILQTGSEFGSLRAGRGVKGQARARRSGSRVTRCR